MIRFSLVVAVLSTLALPALATDGNTTRQPLAALTERTADPAENAPVGEITPVRPTTSIAPIVPPAPDAHVAAPGPIVPSAPVRVADAESPSSSAVSAPPDLSPMLFGLLVVLGVMAGALWLMKRMGMVKTGAASIGRVVGAVSLGNRERLVIVEVADQWIVVGVAPGRVNALAQLPRQERSEAKLETAPAAPNFSDWLKQTIDKRNGSGSNSGSSGR